MKKGVVMRIACEDCGVRYDLTNENYDDYCIIYRMGERAKNGLPMPHLYCPECLKAA